MSKHDGNQCSDRRSDGLLSKSVWALVTEWALLLAYVSLRC